MNRIIIPPKRQGETCLCPVLGFDFQPMIDAQGTISSSSVAASVYSGVDANPSAIVKDATVSTGRTAVTQLVTAGVVGTIYELICTAVTVGGQTLQLAGYLVIIPDLE